MAPSCPNNLSIEQMFRAIELWPAPPRLRPTTPNRTEYAMPETASTDFNRAMQDAKQQAGVANEVSDAASQVADAATNAAGKTAGSFEKALRDTVENQPYTAVAIALGLGWLLGRTHRPF
jgi:ElaB/YqjD/DUF883 family membrane-anchored ribosome-binding protein